MPRPSPAILAPIITRSPARQQMLDVVDRLPHVRRTFCRFFGDSDVSRFAVARETSRSRCPATAATSSSSGIHATHTTTSQVRCSARLRDPCGNLGGRGRSGFQRDAFDASPTSCEAMTPGSLRQFITWWNRPHIAELTGEPPGEAALYADALRRERPVWHKLRSSTCCSIWSRIFRRTS